MITTLTLLNNIVYGTPSGTYDGSSQDWVSTAVKGSDYYHGRGGVQTIGFDVEDFSGEIIIEATLDSNPENAGWFDALDFDESTVQRSQSVIGNFTWVRARVRNFAAGTVNSVTVTY